MNFNQITLGGNITRKPELAFTPSQVEVCTFGMAINKKIRDQDKTCFVDCVAFKTTAVNIEKYFDKGDPILITGELQFESWTAQDGTKRNKHSVFVKEFQFVKPANQGGQQSQQARPQQSAPPAQQQGGFVPDDEVPF